MKKYKITFILLFFTLLFGAVSHAYAANTIHLKGLEDQKELESYLHDKVVLKYKDSEAVNAYAMRQDALKSMKAKGYYAAQVSADHADDVYTITVKPKKPYKINTINIEGFEYKADIGLAKGDVLNADKVLAAQRAIRKEAREEHCYYSFSLHHEITLDHPARLGDIRFIATAGEEAVFGDTVFTGSQRMDEDYLNRFIRYKEGECWKPKKIEETKTALLEGSLLSLAQETLPDAPDQDKRVDIAFELKERAPRSVRLGASYYTDEGPGFLARWTHKNIFGSAEKLTADLKTTSLLQSLGLDFSKPHFLADNQSLSLTSSFERENTDAFEELSFNGGAALKRKLSKVWSGSLGVAAELSQVTDENNEEEEETFGLISVPGVLTFDNRDDKLDPHKGLFFRTGIEPFADVLGEAAPFVRSRVTASTYFDLGDHAVDPVLAVRGSVGSILGEATDNIPVSKRFFAGGGNSVRGFGFQEAGPVEDGDPLGGRSLVEASAEMRFKVTKTIGAVTFVDAGNVFDSAVPNFDGGLFVGAGAGLRYYTDFGPLRFDVGVPLNKREDLDHNFQVYISIGQAF